MRVDENVERGGEGGMCLYINDSQQKRKSRVFLSCTRKAAAVPAAVLLAAKGVRHELFCRCTFARD